MRERVLEPLGLALHGLERRRPAAASGSRRATAPAGDGLHGGGAAGRRRRLRRARRPLQQRARPGALERRVPRRRAAARRARGCAREPRDAARDAARPQRVRARASSGRRWPSRPGVVAGGYGYGLMIWHERDGQRHVGHPGGLPGFGTLMRWVPELGLSVILLANVTYAQVRGAGAARARAGRARGRAAAPHRPRRPGPAGRARRGRRPGRALGRRRGRARCSRRNVDLDRPLAERRAELEALRERHGALRARRRARARATRCAGSWRLRGERGHVELDDHAGADRAAARADARRSSPSCRPSGALAALARPRPRARERAATPRRSTALLAPGADAEEALRGAAGRRGALRPVRRRPSRSRGDGETTTTLRLPGPARRRRARAGARRGRRAPGAPAAAPGGLTEPF